jgi:protein-tyrosine phosphatase
MPIYIINLAYYLKEVMLRLWRNRHKGKIKNATAVGAFPEDGLIDIHCHMLPNVDDGPDSLEKSLNMARMSIDNGISHTVVTPHIHYGRYDNDSASIYRAFSAFKRALKKESIPLKLSMAAEVRIGPELVQMVQQDRIPWLGSHHGYKYLLLEFPHSHIPIGSERLIYWLMRHNIRPVIAHPERNKAVLRNLHAIIPFIELGCMSQITAGSILGKFGPYAKKRAQQLLKRRWTHFIATDAHDTKVRIPDLGSARAAAATIIGEKESRALVLDNPRQILEGSTKQRTQVA